MADTKVVPVSKCYAKWKKVWTQYVYSLSKNVKNIIRNSAQEMIVSAAALKTLSLPHNQNP